MELCRSLQSSSRKEPFCQILRQHIAGAKFDKLSVRFYSVTLCLPCVASERRRASVVILYMIQDIVGSRKNIYHGSCKCRLGRASNLIGRQPDNLPVFSDGERPAGFPVTLHHAAHRFFQREESLVVQSESLFHSGSLNLFVQSFLIVGATKGAVFGPRSHMLYGRADCQ